MRLLPRCVVGSLAFLACLAVGSEHLFAAGEDAKPEGKRVNFKSYDEVELTGTFYRAAPAAGNRDKDTVVMLLHDFNHLKGGGSHQDGWNHLAGELQKAGYNVFSFDFRGFGESKSVGEKFWTFASNRGAGRGRTVKPPSSIDQKEFSQSYYLNLVNDIAAARSYLNVLNDAGDVNSSNIVVIGAGQGATLGALWMASECRRQRDNQSDRLLPGMNPFFRTLDDPEGNDLAAAVWLTISPELERRLLGTAVKSAMVDTAKNARIPTYFLYGKNDDKAATLATNYLNAINNDTGKTSKTESKTESKGVKAKGVPGSGTLAGSMLLSPRQKTSKEIVDFLNRVVEDRGTRVRKDRQDMKYAFCWSLPWPTKNVRARPVAKMPGESVTRIIPSEALGVR
jgi:alpha-beta hydrolase superfamily lysophospholipase